MTKQKGPNETASETIVARRLYFEKFGSKAPCSGVKLRFIVGAITGKKYSTSEAKKWVWLRRAGRPDIKHNKDLRKYRTHTLQEFYKLCPAAARAAYPTPAAEKKKQAKKITRLAKRKVKNQGTQDFYTSREWREVRYYALKEHGASCLACGRSAKDGIIIHVDHIKPRSKYPELELDVNNLQILCADCNLGKGAWDETDWR